MPHREYFAHRFRFHGVLQGSLVIGGFFNFSILHIPLSTPGFYPQRLATPVASLVCTYLLAVLDVRRHSGIAAPAASWWSIWS